MRSLIAGLLFVAGLLGVTHAANATSCPAVGEIVFRLMPETTPGQPVFEEYTVKDPSGKVTWRGEAVGPNFLQPMYQITLTTPTPIANACLYSYREEYVDEGPPPQQAWRKKQLTLNKQP
jgi:hypothetical protein